MPSPTNKQYAERQKLDKESKERLRLALAREKNKKYRIPLPNNQKGFYLVGKVKYKAYLKSLDDKNNG